MRTIVRLAEKLGLQVPAIDDSHPETCRVAEEVFRRHAGAIAEVEHRRTTRLSDIARERLAAGLLETMSQTSERGRDISGRIGSASGRRGGVQQEFTSHVYHAGVAYVSRVRLGEDVEVDSAHDDLRALVLTMVDEVARASR